jgi:hypothetical protein
MQSNPIQLIYKSMNKLFFLALTSLLFLSAAYAQTGDVTLVFKRPYIGAGDSHISKISINGKEVCSFESTTDKIAICTTNVNAGELAIKVTSIRGSDFDYVIDVEKNKIYTLVVYIRNIQTNDLIYSQMNLVKNKAKENEEFNNMSFKAQVISIENKKK